MQQADATYGVGDGSYRAAGGIEGLTALVDAFYDNVCSLPEGMLIRSMYPDDLVLSRQKLAYFLSGWLGGPKLYATHFGGITIPGFHQHMGIGPAERDAWMACMAKAIDAQPYATSFKQYLLTQLGVPAERIRQLCASHIRIET